MEKIKMLISLFSLLFSKEEVKEPVDVKEETPDVLSRLNVGELRSVGHTELIIQTCEKFGLTVEQTAYVVATAYHETAGTMRPIEEYGKGKKYVYGNWTLNSKGVKICPKNSGRTAYYTQKECKHLFYGRGFVQLTWYDNYKKVGKILKDKGYIKNSNLFIEEPEKAMDPQYSAYILVIGMINGLFTGKSLKNYINDTKCDFRDARRIVNGLDKCDLIASYAKSYIV